MAYANVTLNRPDAYIYIQNKNVNVPETIEGSVTVTVGNGFTSQTIPAGAKLEVTMSAAMAASLAPKGTDWGRIGGVAGTCAAIPTPVPTTGTVKLECTLPELAKNKSVNLTMAIVGQVPGRVQTVRFTVSGVENEANANNQTEDLKIITQKLADLKLDTTLVDLSSNAQSPYPSETPSNAVVNALGGQRFRVEGVVTNLGKSDVEKFYVDIPEMLGVSEYTAPDCSLVTLEGGKKVRRCEVNQTLKVGQTYNFSYEFTVQSPQSASDNSEFSQSTSVSLPLADNLPVDAIQGNNTTNIPFSVAASTDLMLEKELVSATPHMRGDAFSYTLTPAYQGLPPAGDMTIVDRLPVGLPRPTAVTTTDGTCAITDEVVAGGTQYVVTCIVPKGERSFASEAQSIGQITIDFDNVGTTLTAVDNEASIAFADGTPDPFAPNNTARAAILAVTEPKYELGLTKNRVVGSNQDAGFARIGDELSYEMSVTNTGNMAFTDKLKAVDVFPVGINYVPDATKEAPWVCTSSTYAAYFGAHGSEAGFARNIGGLTSASSVVECIYTLPADTVVLPNAVQKLALKGVVVGLPNQTVDAYLIENMAAPSWTGPGPGWNWGQLDGHAVSISDTQKAADLSVEKEVAGSQTVVTLFDAQAYAAAPDLAAKIATLKPENYITYNIALENKGPFVAENVTFRDRIDWLGMPGFDGANAFNHVIKLEGAPAECRIAPVANAPHSAEVLCEWLGATTLPIGKVNFSITVLAGATGADVNGTISNSASFNSSVTPDPDYSNNRAESAKVSYSARYDLTVNKKSELQSGQALLGQAYNYTIQVENVANGEFRDRTAAQNFTITDRFPAGLRVLEIKPSAGSFTCGVVSNLNANGVTTDRSELVCTHAGAIGVGVVREIQIVAEGSSELLSSMAGTPRQVKLRNNVEVTPGDDREVDIKTNTSYADATFIDGKYELEISKVFVPANSEQTNYVKSGEEVEFLITVKNNGPSRAEQVVMLDGLPLLSPAAGAKFELLAVIPASTLPSTACGTGPNGFSLSSGYANLYGSTANNPSPMGNGQLITCQLGNLAKDQSTTVRVRGRMLDEGVIENTASVSAARLDGMDDLDYENNSTNTSVTAQALVDLKVTKKTLPRSQSVNGNSSETYLHGDKIGFRIDLLNVGRDAAGIYAAGSEVAEIQPFFTDAKNVTLRDVLPSGLVFEAGASVTPQYTLGDPSSDSATWQSFPYTACVISGTPRNTLECTFESIPNGALVRVDVVALVDENLPVTICTSNCGAAGQNKITLKNTAALTTTSFQPDTNPGDKEEAESNVDILLSSLSGNYYWDMRDSELTNTAWPRENVGIDVPVTEQELILLRKEGTEWTEVARSKTTTTGAYDFGNLIPGTYKVVDALGFQNNSTLVVNTREAVAGAVTAGTIQSGAPTGTTLTNTAAFGSNTHLKTNTLERGITEIILGQNEHGTNYDFRVVPVPALEIDKSSKLTQHPNGLVQIDYSIRVAQKDGKGLEPIIDLVLTDDFAGAFGTYSTDLKAAYDAALAQASGSSEERRIAAIKTLSTSATLGAGRNYYVTPPYVSEFVDPATLANPPMGLTAVARPTMTAGFTGETATSTIFTAGKLNPANGSVTVTFSVLMNLGQPVAANPPEDYANTAKATGSGAWTGFTPDPTVPTTQTETERKTPNLDVKDSTTDPIVLTQGIGLVKGQMRNDDFERLSGLADTFGRQVYTFVITNTGKLPLTNITLTDVHLGLNRSLDGLYIKTGDNKAELISSLTPRPRALDVLFAGESITLYGLMEFDRHPNQAAIEAGTSFRNTAYVYGTGTEEKTASDYEDVKLAYTFTKSVTVWRGTSVATAPYRAGDELRYSLEVKNTGNIDIEINSIKDDILATGNALYKQQGRSLTNLTAAESRLRVGETETFSNIVTYTIRQSDIDALAVDASHPLLAIGPTNNRLTNTASLVAEITPNDPMPPKESTTTTPLVRTSSVETQKISDFAPSRIYQAGDVVNYAIVVRNTGNTTLERITISDPLLNIVGHVEAVSLAPGKSIIFAPAAYPTAEIAKYDEHVSMQALALSVTQSQIDALTLVNRASVNSKPIGDTEIPTTPEVTIQFKPDQAIDLVKTVLPETPLAFNEQTAQNAVTYRFVVTNTGNVTLQNVRLNDPLLGYTNLALLDAGSGRGTLGTTAQTGMSLAPKQSVTVEVSHLYSLVKSTYGADTARYESILKMVNDGTIRNTATTQGTHNGQTPTDEDFSDLPVARNPAMSLLKTGVAVNRDGLPTATSEAAGVAYRVDWTIQVQNTGNVTLSNVKVTDPSVEGFGTKDIAQLLPGEIVTYTISKNTNLEQRDAAEAINTVIVNYDSPVGPETKTTTTRVDLEHKPALTLVKHAPTFNADVPAKAGDTLVYEFLVTNTGNVSVTLDELIDAPLGINTANTLPAGVTVNLGLRLAPGETKVFGTATTTITQAQIDDGEAENNATVSGETDDKTPVTTPDDVTVPFIRVPAIMVEKTAVVAGTGPNNTVQLGDWATWTVRVTNTGNVTLSDAIVVEGNYDFQPNEEPWRVQPIVFAAVPNEPRGVSVIADLAPAEFAEFTLRAQVTAADIARGYIENSATATGEVKEDSSLTPPTTSVTKTETLDLYSAVSIEKSHSGVNANTPYPHVENGVLRHRFDIVVTNTGNMPLVDLVVEDSISGVKFDVAYIPQIIDVGGARSNVTGGTFAADGKTYTALSTFKLLPGEKLQLQAIYDVPAQPTGQDLVYVNNGGYTNIASVSGVGKHPETDDSTPVSDRTTEDAKLAQTPKFVIEKIAQPKEINKGIEPAEVGSIVPFEIVVTNTGNVTLKDIEVYDERVQATGTIAVVPSLDPGASLKLVASGLIAQSVLEAAVNQAELDAGKLVNTARAEVDFTPTDPDAPPHDLTGSHSTTTPLKVLDEDISFTLVKAVDQAATLLSSPPALGDQVAYTFTVTNTGIVALDLSDLIDGLPSFVFTEGLTSQNAKLARGATIVFKGYYNLVQADLDRGWLRNTAKVTGEYPADPTKPPVTEESTVVVDLTPEPELSLVKTADSSALSVPPEVGQPIRYTFVVTNTGLVTVKNLVLTDKLAGVVLDSSTLASLAPAASETFTGTYYITQDDLDRGNLDNTATVEGEWVPEKKDPNDPDPTPVGVTEDSKTPEGNKEPTRVTFIMLGEFSATKEADIERVIAGDSVGYTLTFESQSTGRVAQLDILDRLPAGMIYTPDSAEVTVLTAEGVGTAQAIEPQRTGRVLTWPVENIPRLGKVVITFRARVSGQADYGPLTNQTWSQTPDGDKNSNTATATVYRDPEHVFECSDVTGKVYEDLNLNGRQDPRDTSAITNDDTFTGGKFGKYDEAPREPRGERGLPNVRLVTPNGTIITTDEHGRYSVPCAELPRDIGTNFTLKLDPQSLPTGFHVVSENPRTMRLTAGIGTEMNFGATLAKLVRLDLSADAFVGVEMSDALKAALQDYVATAADEPIVLQLGYIFTANEARDVMRARLDVVEGFMLQAWRGRSSNLLLERSFEQVQGQ